MTMATIATRLRRLLVVCSVGLVFAPAAQAHHSQSEFDLRSKLEVEGVVTKLEWKSPHARLYVDVKDDKGEVVNWNFELPSPNTLMRRGWKRDGVGGRHRNRLARAVPRVIPGRLCSCCNAARQ